MHRNKLDDSSVLTLEIVLESIEADNKNGQCCHIIPFAMKVEPDLITKLLKEGYTVSFISPMGLSDAPLKDILITW